MKWTEQDLENRRSLTQFIRNLNSLGQCPATSGNYSFRIERPEGLFAVSQSGVDKEFFDHDNFVVVDENGKLQKEYLIPGLKSSDETLLHLAVYAETAAGCVVHVHGLESLMFADLFPGQEYGVFEGMEMQKAFAGQNTHENSLRVPIFENSQDIADLSRKVKPILKGSDLAPGLILRGHGLYVWGKDVMEAKRHFEAFQYLFKYYVSKKG